MDLARGNVLTDGEDGPLEYEVSVHDLQPLRVEFQLRRPLDATGGAFAPLLLGPLGYFVEVVVETLVGERLYSTTRPKVKLKLRPESDDSYVELAPGEVRGDVLVDDDAEIDKRAGRYVVRVTYSNREFRGTATRPVGSLTAEAVVDVHR